MKKLLAAFTLIVFAAVAADDDRAADRDAIRAHIDRIFQAFINKDAAELRATHDENWRGFLEGSGKIIRGIDAYMKSTGVGSGGTSPYGMTGYKMREFDIIFQGDAAFATFVAEVDSNTPTGPAHTVLRIGDFYAKKNGHWVQAGSDTQVHPEVLNERYTTAVTLPDPLKKSLLDAREAVWRAYFSGDRATLEKLLPEDTITIDPGPAAFGTRDAALNGSAQFAKSGGKLVKLEFPDTRIQCYGRTAIVYSSYVYEIESAGKRTTRNGRATEVFLFRNGQWVNPGWHLDAAN